MPRHAAPQPTVLPALVPDPEQDRIADLGYARQRPFRSEIGEVERERGVRQDEVTLVEDEGVLASSVSMLVMNSDSVGIVMVETSTPRTLPSTTRVRCRLTTVMPSSLT